MWVTKGDTRSLDYSSGSAARTSGWGLMRLALSLRLCTDGFLGDFRIPSIRGTALGYP